MTILEAIVLGVLQGTTEFIPVSSSGHLVLIPWLFGWGSPGLTYTIAVHFGTMFAVLVYFHRDWLDMLKGSLRWTRERKLNPQFKLLLLLIMGTIPAAVLGYLFEDFFIRIFENPLVAALMLLVTAGLLLVGEALGQLRRTLGDLTWLDSLTIGLAQAFAIFPGISRSGSTIAAGRLRDIKREDAARFSFLLATPIIMGASLFQVIDLLVMGTDSTHWLLLLAGFLSAFISGYLVIHWLLSFLRTRPTTIFAIYCIAASLASLTVLAVRG
jgi:undecaprenyl-diphosphatase